MTSSDERMSHGHVTLEGHPLLRQRKLFIGTDKTDSQAEKLFHVSEILVCNMQSMHLGNKCERFC